jgi:hypothetical protein
MLINIETAVALGKVTALFVTDVLMHGHLADPDRELDITTQEHNCLRLANELYEEKLATKKKNSRTKEAIFHWITST